ncbi:hypothetical protein ACH5RR_025647 [Cinchona calisaya]|uniref:UDP-glycosyltransferases domain-containing protein n=1 Tax=Cinchona calisaya TaxID=153742 RepID=A0ABD2Z087_9GENT
MLSLQRTKSTVCHNPLHSQAHASRWRKRHANLRWLRRRWIQGSLPVLKPILGVLSFPVDQERVPLILPGLPPLGLDELPSFLACSTYHDSAYLTAIMEKFRRLEENDWVFVNSFEELENQLAEAMPGLWPVQMVGPLVPSAYVDGPIAEDRAYGGSLLKSNDDHYLKWLDTKAPNTIIFVSFGSMAQIEIKQIEEIAYGLKSSKNRFLWVVKDSEQEKLPIQFLQSIDEMGCGKIVTWCNQVEILAHKSVGCFMTHCGWNSTLEAISLGVPRVAMPQWSDQPTNAKFAENVWRVGVSAKKGENGIVLREEIESKKKTQKMSQQVKQSEGSSKLLGLEQVNFSDFEGLMVFVSKKMEEFEDTMTQFKSRIGLLEQRMNQKIMELQYTVEKLLESTRSNPENKMHDTKQRCLKLQFNYDISSPILTGEQIRGEGGKVMQVSLVDNNAGTVVDFGPEASAKVEIVALEGDLNEWEGDTWTAEEFQSKIAGERKGKKSVLAGDVQLKLNKGIVSLSDVKFRSSQLHISGVFKLGARVVDTCRGSRVIEAMTKPFQVKDYRQKYNQKHQFPSASDEVWRLKNISKGGRIYERLASEEVNTVGDFNTLHLKDPEKLKRLFGLSEKKWEATVNHAQRCIPDKNINRCQENTGGVKAVGQTHASMLVAPAYEHEGVVSSGNEASLRQYSSHSLSAMEPEIGKFDHTKLNSAFVSSNPEMVDCDHTNLGTPFEDTLSSCNPTGCPRVTDFRNSSDSSLQGLDSYSTSNGPFIIEYSQEYNVSDLLDDVSAVPKKMWTILFHILRWRSRRKRIAAFEGNQHQKKQRVCI